LSYGRVVFLQPVKRPACSTRPGFAWRRVWLLFVDPTTQ